MLLCVVAMIAAAKDFKTVVFTTTPQMHCQSCEAKIKGNLRFEKGQVVVLLGPSGSGKSTLIRTINGLEAVDKGSLLVNGHQVAGASQKDLVPLRKEVGMVSNISTSIHTKQC